MMTVSFPIEKGNEAIRDGSLPRLLQSFIEEHKPEAAYFSTDVDGERGGIIVVDLKSPSDMVTLAEPWFTKLNARVTFKPVMTVEDVAAGMKSAGREFARN